MSLAEGRPNMLCLAPKRFAWHASPVGRSRRAMMRGRFTANDVLGVMAVALAALIWACSSTTSESSPQTADDAGAEAAQPDDAGQTPADAGEPTGSTGGPVDLGSVFNARHTGGLTTQSGQTVRANLLIRSGQIITTDACSALASLGVRTVIDLRAASAVAADPDVDCVHSTTNYYNADIPKILPPGQDTYLQTLDAIEPKLGEIFSRLSADAALPAIIHCVIGRDRASMVMALVLLSLGVPEDQVMLDFEHNQETGTDPTWMSGVLQRIEAAGGIAPYLAQHWVATVQLESLRAAALE
jgi:protein-tyrosine phosphatase